MLRLLSPKVPMDPKIFEKKHLDSVMLVFIMQLSLSTILKMSTHVPGIQSFLSLFCIISYQLAKIATSSRQLMHINNMLEIEISRIYFLKRVGVLRGDFEGLGVRVLARN